MNPHIMAAATIPLAVRLNPMHEGMVNISANLMTFLGAGSVAMILITMLVGKIGGRAENLVPFTGSITVLLMIAVPVASAVGTYPNPSDASDIRTSLESAYKVKIKSDGGIFDGASQDNKGVDAAKVSFVGRDGVIRSGQLNRKGMDFTLYTTDDKGHLTPYAPTAAATQPCQPSTAYDYGGVKSGS